MYISPSHCAIRATLWVEDRLTMKLKLTQLYSYTNITHKQTTKAEWAQRAGLFRRRRMASDRNVTVSSDAIIFARCRICGVQLSTTPRQLFHGLLMELRISKHSRSVRSSAKTWNTPAHSTSARRDKCSNTLLFTLELSLYAFIMKNVK